MKKITLIALLGLLLVFGAKVFAQEDSIKGSETRQDTISIDSEAPKYYEEQEAPKKTDNSTNYTIIGGVIVFGFILLAISRKKKKE